jgi:hypothetical protein
LTPSLTVSVTVHTPLSLHVIDGLGTTAFEIVHSAPGPTPESGVAVHVYWSGSFSGSVTVAKSGIAEPSLPPVSPTWTSGGALTTSVFESEPVPPSLSATVTVTVYVPAAAYVCGAVHSRSVPTKSVSVAPSPQSIEHVSVSIVPGSTIETSAVTGEPSGYGPGGDRVSVAVGQVTVVDGELGSANAQGPVLIAHVVVPSLAVAEIGNAVPSSVVPALPEPSPTVTVGGALTVTSTQSAEVPLPPPSLPVAVAQMWCGPGVSAGSVLVHDVVAGPFTGSAGEVVVARACRRRPRR